MKTVKWTKKAHKQLRKIKSLKLQNDIYEAVEELRHFPDCVNVKKLTDHAYPYRLRVKNYRVFFNEHMEIIEVQEVKKRDEQTY